MQFDDRYYSDGHYLAYMQYMTWLLTTEDGGRTLRLGQADDVRLIWAYYA